MLVGVGYFLPPIFLPTYARSIGGGNFASILTVMFLNLAASIGNICMGLIMGKLHFTTCALISTVGTVLSVFFFWGFAESLPLLYVFCILYGLFASSFPGTWSGVVRDEYEKRPGTDMGMIFATFAASKGIGNVASGPLSEALLSSGAWHGAKFAYGSMYGVLIIFTGTMAFCGSFSFAARRIGWL
jgi:MFS family permease